MPELLRDRELRAVISLPRLFKSNNAQMAVVYLARNSDWNRDQRVLMASVTKWKDEDGDEYDTDIAAALSRSLISPILYCQAVDLAKMFEVPRYKFGAMREGDACDEQVASPDLPQSPLPSQPVKLIRGVARHGDNVQIGEERFAGLQPVLRLQQLFAIIRLEEILETSAQDLAFSDDGRSKKLPRINVVDPRRRVRSRHAAARARRCRAGSFSALGHWPTSRLIDILEHGGHPGVVFRDSGVTREPLLRR